MLGKLYFMQELAETVNPPRIVIDLQNVKFVGSAFLGRMVTIHKILIALESGRFAICGLNSFCRAAISATKLDTLFELFENVEAAVQALSSDR